MAAESETNPFLDHLPSLLLVLNRHRQVVYTNQKVLSQLGADKGEFLQGKRPGELLDCVHASELPGGCGTAEACTTCGAALAILSSQGGRPDERECRITQMGSGDALDYRVMTAPLQIGGEPFTLFILTDISDEKRRRVLERLFFHDVLNTAGGLRGFAEVALGMFPDDESGLIATIYRIADTVIDEIQAHKDLMAAENHDLAVHPETVTAAEIVNEVAQAYRNHLVAEDKHIVVDGGPAASLVTDRGLLRRVLGNMLKNALEASRDGQTVRLGWDREEGEMVFWVQNSGFMSKDVQLQVFSRSFSTKGSGRGLGTHSMRLLTERYLKGSISFDSSTETGTIFRVRLSLDGAPVRASRP